MRSLRSTKKILSHILEIDRPEITRKSKGGRLHLENAYCQLRRVEYDVPF